MSAAYEALEPADVARLLMAAGVAGEGLGAFTRLALVAGARRAELLAVRWPDLGWPAEPGETGTLAIACRDGGKTAHARREIALDAVTMEALAGWRSTRLAMATHLGIEAEEAGYVFASDSACKRPLLAETATRQVMRAAAQTGVSVTLSGLRRYSMTRLAMLGVPVDVITYRMGVSPQPGMVPLSWYGEALARADREAAILLARDLDEVFAPADSGNGQDG